MASLGNTLKAYKAKFAKFPKTNKNYSTFLGDSNDIQKGQKLVISLGEVTNGGSLKRKCYLFSDDLSMSLVQTAFTSSTDGSVTFYNIPTGKYKVMIEGNVIDADTVNYQSIIYDNIVVTDPLSISKILPICTQGSSYSATLTISGGITPYDNLVAIGLPDGITALLSDSTITLSGTSTVSGNQSISLSITDHVGDSITQNYNLYVFGSNEWTPQELFNVSGTYGFWYDFTDMSTLFQDAASTIPVTDVGQPLLSIVDKSGNGNKASCNVQTYNQYLHSIDIDEAGFTYSKQSSNYYLTGTLTNFTGNFDGNTSKTLISVLNTEGWSSPNYEGALFYLGDTSDSIANDSTNYINRFITTYSRANTNIPTCKLIQGFEYVNYSAHRFSSVSTFATIDTVNQINLLEYQKDSNTLSIYHNGLQKISSISSTIANLTSSSYTLFGPITVLNSSINSEVYHIILLNRSLSDDERTSLSTWYEKYKGNTKVKYPKPNSMDQTIIVNEAVDFTYDITYGNSPSDFSIISGNLPTGLTMDDTGHITGTPTETGVFGYILGFNDTVFGNVAIQQYTYVANSIAYTLNSTGSDISDWSYSFNMTPIQSQDNMSILCCSCERYSLSNNYMPFIYMNNTYGNIFVFNGKTDSSCVLKFGCDANGNGYYIQILPLTANNNACQVYRQTGTNWTANTGVTNIISWAQTYSPLVYENFSVYIDFTTPTATNIWMNGVQIGTAINLTTQGNYIGLGVQSYLYKNPLPSSLMGLSILS